MSNYRIVRNLLEWEDDPEVSQINYEAEAEAMAAVLNARKGGKLLLANAGLWYYIDLHSVPKGARWGKRNSEYSTRGRRMDVYPYNNQRNPLPGDLVKCPAPRNNLKVGVTLAEVYSTGHIRYKNPWCWVMMLTGPRRNKRAYKSIRTLEIVVYREGRNPDTFSDKLKRRIDNGSFH